MTTVPIQEILNAFPFLDERIAQEPFLYDVLMEIKISQANFNDRKSKFLATTAQIKKSSSIRMPFTPARNKNIDYLLELLVERYPNYVQRILHFKINIDEKSKKIKLDEIFEYTVNLANKTIASLQANRDKFSLESVSSLLKRFRIFNLSKLLKQSKNKKALSTVLKKGLGSNIFTFKSFFLSKDNLEFSEDHCFHAINYEAVKKTLNIKKVKEIIVTYEELIKHKLKRFGIINANFSDYRDNKLNYILHILIDDLESSIGPSDHINVKNFHSLRECILKVDKILDPAHILSDDIVKFIKENKFCHENDIISNVLNLTADILEKWGTDENLKKNKILKHTDSENQIYYIDGSAFIIAFQSTYETLCLNPEKLSSMSSFQKEFINKKMDVFYNSAKALSDKSDFRSLIDASDNDLSTLKHLINEYEQYLKKINLEHELSKKNNSTPKKKKSLFKSILTGIFSIFGIFSSKKTTSTTKGGLSEKTGRKKHIMKATKQIYSKASSKSGPIIPLSNLLELSPENDALVDEIISQLRDNNMKLVVPIYNARTVLYPKRSQKLLISDVEYLLVPPYVIKSPESITSYIDSLVGFKIKDDILQGKALIVIEKYLKTLHRQKRALLMKKNM